MLKWRLSLCHSARWSVILIRRIKSVGRCASLNSLLTLTQAGFRRVTVDMQS